MRHTDHPNWKNLSNAEKNRVRQTNYRRGGLRREIRELERHISEKPSFVLMGLLKRKKHALDNNPFYEGDEDRNFIEDVRNIFLDYEKGNYK